ncbi:MAG TPA: hypothetical protein VMF58_18535 [Rhizomicrobium sp.]|nr:hypothetical protein [Rhizomicrobium sp.]
MAILKTQQWRPDTHPGYILEVEWEYDKTTGRDTGREHHGVSVQYPDGTIIHRDSHGADVAHQRYKKLHAEHIVKNQAYAIILDALPARMKKPLLDSDNDPLLDEAGHPRLVVKDKHKPVFAHLGEGRYEFVVPGLDEGSRHALAEKLGRKLGDGVITLKSA